MPPRVRIQPTRSAAASPASIGSAIAIRPRTMNTIAIANDQPLSFEIIVASTPRRRRPAVVRGLRGSVPLRNETPPRDRRLVVVGVLLRAIRQLHLRIIDLLVGNELQQLRDRVEAGALLVVGPDDVPRREALVGRLHHR